jgi:T-complex protein 11
MSNNEDDSFLQENDHENNGKRNIFIDFGHLEEESRVTPSPSPALLDRLSRKSVSSNGAVDAVGFLPSLNDSHLIEEKINKIRSTFDREKKLNSIHTDNAARISRMTLHKLAEERERRNARIDLELNLKAAETRKEAALQTRALEAAHHVEHSKRIATKVRAVRAIQAWFRMRRFTKLGLKNVNSIFRSKKERNVQLTPSFPSRVQKDSNLSTIVAMNTFIQTLSEDGFLTGLKIVGTAMFGSATTIPSFISSSSPSTTLNSDLPYSTFDLCANAIQQKELIEKSKGVLDVILKSFEVLERSDNEGTIDGNAAPYLRPTMAKSARTFLAALLVGYFPTETLEASLDEHPQPSEARSSRAKHQRAKNLVDASRKLIATTHSLVQSLVFPSNQLAFQFPSICQDFRVPMNVEQSVWIPQAFIDANYDHALFLHVFFAFVDAWVTYMDTFMVWKLGDSILVAQTFCRDYQRLVVEQHKLAREATSITGQNDAGLHELREGVESHVKLITEQVTTLLGPQQAKSWIREQQVLARALISSQSSRPSLSGASTPARDRAASVARSGASSAATSPQVTHSGGGYSRTSLFRNVFSNERFAHELILNPDFQLPVPNPPAGVLLEQPSTQSQHTEFRFDLSHANDGLLREIQGDPAMTLKMTPAFWSAALHSAAECDKNHLTSTESNVVDLLGSGLESILDAIASVIPHRRDMHANISSGMDVPHVKSMIVRQAFVASDWLLLLDYIVSILMSLEAPVRNDSTKEWVDQLKLHLQSASSESASMHSDQPLSQYLSSPLFEFIPRIFSWIHWKFLQIRIDVSNAQLAELSVYLRTGNRGVEYERGKFVSALEQGKASLEFTNQWMKFHVTLLVDELKLQVETQKFNQVVQTLSEPHDLHRFILLREGALSIISCSKPVTFLCRSQQQQQTGTPPDDDADASNTSFPFPETLYLDAFSLKNMQDKVQTLVLVPLISIIMSQVISNSPFNPSTISHASTVQQLNTASTLEEAQEQLTIWLLGSLDDPPSDENTMKLTDLINGIIQLTDILMCKENKIPLVLPTDDPRHQQAESMKLNLSNALKKAISSEHILYATYLNKVIKVLRGRLTQRIAIASPVQSCDETIRDTFWSKYLTQSFQSWEQFPEVISKPLQKVQSYNKVMDDLVERLSTLLLHNHSVHQERYHKAIQEALTSSHASIDE